jgi:hypothetical protein
MTMITVLLIMRIEDIDYEAWEEQEGRCRVQYRRSMPFTLAEEEEDGSVGDRGKEEAGWGDAEACRR